MASCAGQGPRKDNSVMHVVSVNLGRARPMVIGSRQASSAIGKQPAAGRVAAQPLGLEGDEQADLSVHGGLSKAVYAYPGEHFAFWRTVRAQAGVAAWDAAVEPGLLGENLTLAGLTEDRVWIGDLLRFPHCVLAVSEPRYPCFKLNAALGFRHAATLMVQSAWCGFYLGVLVPGSIAAGEAFALEAGPRDVRIDELFRATASARRASVAW
jgi:MOSC domain-containing protein YiiM